MKAVQQSSIALLILVSSAAYAIGQSNGPADRLAALPCNQVSQSVFARQSWLSPNGSPYGLPLGEWSNREFDALKSRILACAGGRSGDAASQVRYVEYIERLTANQRANAQASEQQRQIAARNAQIAKEEMQRSRAQQDEAARRSQAAYDEMNRRNREAREAEEAARRADEAARAYKAAAVRRIAEAETAKRVAEEEAARRADEAARADKAAADRRIAEAETAKRLADEEVTRRAEERARAAQNSAPANARVAAGNVANAGSSSHQSDAVPTWMFVAVAYAFVAGLIALPLVRPPLIEWYRSSTWFIFGSGPVDILLRQIGFRLSFELFIFGISCVIGSLGGAIYVIARRYTAVRRAAV